ncbi:MAG: carbohydrate porin [Planctomycetes bacterium]|nr:carbohydrate porin [Planctomycetota bacterium]MCB9903026.1 carbohydrate porin [Planctomycetota bacterium]
MMFLPFVLSGGAFVGLLQRAEIVSASAETRDQAAVQQPDLETLVQNDLRKRDVPLEKLDASRSGWFGRFVLDWGGGRRRLEDLGLSIEMLYTTDGSYAVAGGADPRGTALRGLLDVTFTYDTEPALGVRGGTLHAGLQWINGADGSGRFGVAQAFSNIDSEHRFQLGRVWYEQFVEGAGTRVRLGKIDANSLFAYVESGGQFIHSSMGFSPTIYLMPTYPDAAFGLAVVQSVGGGVELRAGVFDGSFARGVRTGQDGPQTVFRGPHDLFFIGEADLAWDDDSPGRAGFGAWAHDGDLERFDGGTEHGTAGLYALLEQRVWSSARVEGRHVDGFVQLGWADADVSPFENHLGLGAQWTNAFTSRQDRLGLGLTRAGLSGAPGAGFTENAETAVELFYGFELAPWVRAKPDLQYVRNPGGDAALDDAWIATLRVTFSL